MKKKLAVVSSVLLALSMAIAQRLPETARPENYKLTLNAVDIDFHEVTIASGGTTQKRGLRLTKKKKWSCCRSRNRWLPVRRRSTSPIQVFSTARCGAYISARTIRGADTPPRSWNPPPPAAPFLRLTNPTTKRLLTSRPSPTKGRSQ